MSVLHGANDEPVEEDAEASADELRTAVVLGQNGAIDLHLVSSVDAVLGEGEELVAPRAEGGADPTAHEERAEGVEGADVGASGVRCAGSDDDGDGGTKSSGGRRRCKSLLEETTAEHLVFCLWWMCVSFFLFLNEEE